MSIKALSRIDVLEKIKSKQLTQKLAAEHLGLSRKSIDSTKNIVNKGRQD